VFKRDRKGCLVSAGFGQPHQSDGVRPAGLVYFAATELGVGIPVFYAQPSGKVLAEQGERALGARSGGKSGTDAWFDTDVNEHYSGWLQASGDG